jgi:hypothetical protein
VSAEKPLDDWPSAAAVRAALKDITASEVFGDAPLMTKFLTFVVEEAISGRVTEIKESVLGVEVFKKADWKESGIVRVEARRLRRMLTEYYATEDGAHNPIRIDVAKGAYVPSFTRNIAPGDTLEGFLKWSNSRFFDLVSKVSRGAEAEDEDLRIVMTAFSCGVADMGLEDLLAKNVRIKIVMLNPQNIPLITARHGLRLDEFTVEDGRHQLHDQYKKLKALASYPATLRGCLGKLEVRVSDAMPSGFVAHTKDWAVVGLFLAQGSYVTGPMIDVRPNTDLWEKLYIDWKVRFDAGSEDLQNRTPTPANSDPS